MHLLEIPRKCEKTQKTRPCTAADLRYRRYASIKNLQGENKAYSIEDWGNVSRIKNGEPSAKAGQERFLRDWRGDAATIGRLRIKLRRGRS